MRSSALITASFALLATALPVDETVEASDALSARAAGTTLMAYVGSTPVEVPSGLVAPILEQLQQDKGGNTKEPIPVDVGSDEEAEDDEATKEKRALLTRATLVNGGHSGDSNYKAAVLTHHNAHRSNHSAKALVWDNSLESSAETIARSCNYAHNTKVAGGGYGQNIAAGIPGLAVSEVISDLFYNAEMTYYKNLYGQANPSMTNFEKWGHFSQIVWKATTHVGCWTQYCSGGLKGVSSNIPPYFTVCNYKSPGNYGGEYGSNIGKPLGHATIHGGVHHD